MTFIIAIQVVIDFVLLFSLKRFQRIRFSNVQTEEAPFSIKFFRTDFSIHRVIF